MKTVLTPCSGVIFFRGTGEGVCSHIHYWEQDSRFELCRSGCNQPGLAAMFDNVPSEPLGHLGNVLNVMVFPSLAWCLHIIETPKVFGASFHTLRLRPKWSFLGSDTLCLCRMCAALLPYYMDWEYGFQNQSQLTILAYTLALSLLNLGAGHSPFSLCLSTCLCIMLTWLLGELKDILSVKCLGWTLHLAEDFSVDSVFLKRSRECDQGNWSSSQSNSMNSMTCPSLAGGLQKACTAPL